MPKRFYVLSAFDFRILEFHSALRCFAFRIYLPVLRQFCNNMLYDKLKFHMLSRPHVINHKLVNVLTGKCFYWEKLLPMDHPQMVVGLKVNQIPLKDGSLPAMNIKCSSEPLASFIRTNGWLIDPLHARCITLHLRRMYTERKEFLIGNS